jgi:hypothetical protein
VDLMWIDCFEMPVSCARRLSDFRGVCSNLASFRPLSFLSVSNWHFVTGFLSRSNPVHLTFLISSWMPLVLGTVFMGTFTTFSTTHSSRTTFQVRFLQKYKMFKSFSKHNHRQTNNHYLTQCQT